MNYITQLIQAEQMVAKVDKLSDDLCRKKITQAEFVEGMKALGFQMPDIEGEIEMLMS